MLQLQLSQDKFALVDDADFPLLNDFKWCFRRESKGSEGYAVRHTRVDGKDRLLYLHRLLMEPEAGHEVIFLNGDKLDCRRENLRVVTVTEARQHHLRARSNSKSKIKGIRYNRRARTWSVDIYRNGQAWRVGTFWTLKEAQDAHQEALRRENPDLHRAPERVERPSNPVLVQRENTDVV